MFFFFIQICPVEQDAFLWSEIMPRIMSMSVGGKVSGSEMGEMERAVGGSLTSSLTNQSREEKKSIKEQSYRNVKY